MPGARLRSVKSPRLHWSPGVAFGKDRSPRPCYETDIRAASSGPYRFLFSGQTSDKTQKAEMRYHNLVRSVAASSPSRFH